MKIATYNVNGIRAALSKNLLEWMDNTNADVYCLQEVKAEPGQLDMEPFRQRGYEVHWHHAVKKGYSGVALITRKKPALVTTGCGNPLYDNEGRVLRADYDNCSVMSVYMPSGSSGELRQAFKMEWLDWFYTYVENLKKEVPNLIICGDFNICHQAIDIHDPKGNAKNSGFLPEERDWMSKFIGSGFIDTFRHLNKDPHHYTWWTFRANARANNKGWRIDYIMAANPLEKHIDTTRIHPDAVHSDHCPMVTEFKF